MSIKTAVISQLKINPKNNFSDSNNTSQSLLVSSVTELEGIHSSKGHPLSVVHYNSIVNEFNGIIDNNNHVLIYKYTKIQKFVGTIVQCKSL